MLKNNAAIIQAAEDIYSFTGESTTLLPRTHCCIWLILQMICISWKVPLMCKLFKIQPPLIWLPKTLLKTTAQNWEQERTGAEEQRGSASQLADDSFNICDTGLLKSIIWCGCDLCHTRCHSFCHSHGRLKPMMDSFLERTLVYRIIRTVASVIAEWMLCPVNRCLYSRKKPKRRL